MPPGACGRVNSVADRAQVFDDSVSEEGTRIRQTQNLRLTLSGKESVMTILRQRMTEVLKIRNHAPRTRGGFRPRERTGSKVTTAFDQVLLTPTPN